MLERTTALPIDEAYIELRRILLDKNCQLLQTIPPYAIEVRQGSWTGISPITMAKHLRFRLYPDDNGTKVSSIAYWPTVLKASLIIGYIACLFLLAFATIVLAHNIPVPLLRSPYGTTIIVLSSIVGVLAIIHIYSYFRRGNATRQILNLLKARGSPLHVSLRKLRIRGQSTVTKKSAIPSSVN